MCSVAASSQRHRQQHEMSLSMPDNWTSSFSSPRRKGQTQAARTLLRADSTLSMTPQQNSKSVKLMSALEEQQQTIEHMRGVVEDYKAQLNLMVNKVQYSNEEVKLLKGKVCHRNNEIGALSERVRELEELLQQSRSREAAVEKRLTLSESCRSNTARELARRNKQDKQQHKQKVPTGRKTTSLSNATATSCTSSSPKNNSLHTSNGSCEWKESGMTSESQHGIGGGDDRHEFVDVSNRQEVVIKTELTSLMNQIMEWNTNGIATGMKGKCDWLEYIYTQLQGMNAKIK